MLYKCDFDTNDYEDVCGIDTQDSNNEIPDDTLASNPFVWADQGYVYVLGEVGSSSDVKVG